MRGKPCLENIMCSREKGQLPLENVWSGARLDFWTVDLNTLSGAKIVVSIAPWQLPGLPTSDPALPDFGVFTGELMVRGHPRLQHPSNDLDLKGS